jgi:hypothetical protein
MSTQSTADRIPFVPGTVAGLAAWVLSYLFTYVVTSPDISNSLLGRFTDLPTWKIVGWVFYNAHFASTNYQVAFLEGSVNAVGGQDGFTPLLFVIPPLVLLAAGLAVGRAAGAVDLESSALAGLAVVPGYLLLSVAGVFLFATENATPNVVTGIFLAGLVYPAVFGVLGSVVASRT